MLNKHQRHLSTLFGAVHALRTRPLPFQGISNPAPAGGCFALIAACGVSQASLRRVPSSLPRRVPSKACGVSQARLAACPKQGLRRVPRMPPKRRTTTSGSINNKVGPGGLTPAAKATVVTHVTNVNAKHMAAMKDKIDAILRRNIFKGITKAEPLQIAATGRRTSSGGTGATFDNDMFKSAMKDSKSGCYHAVGNLWWHDCLRTLSPNVPINVRAVEKLADQHFASPARLESLLIAVMDANVDDDPMGSIGSWIRITPDELIHAFLTAVYKDVVCAEDPAASEATKTEAEQKLSSWRRVMLTVPMTFEKFPSKDAVFWRSVTIRQNLQAEHQAVVRTTFQMAHEIADVKRQKEQTTGAPCSAKSVYEAYLANARMYGAVGEDEFTFNSVDNALTVNSRILSNKALSGQVFLGY